MEKEKALDINDFVYLLLATLAQNTGTIVFKDKNKKIISLPVQYKQIIENILCENNSWKEEFSILIDTDEYFEDHFAWENKLSLSLKETLNDMNKSYEYDFVYDSLLITFTQDEVDTMLLRYPEQETKDVMDHFSRLLTDYIYTREYQERIHDYYADAVSKMKNKNNLEFDDINITNDKKKIKSLFKKR